MLALARPPARVVVVQAASKRFAIRASGILMSPGKVIANSSPITKPAARYSGTPGSVEPSSIRLKPASAAARWHFSMSRMPNPRRAHFGATPDLTGPGCSPFASGPNGPVPPNCRMPSFTDVDLTGSWQITSNISINGAILNAFDRSPPLDIIDYAALNYNPTYAQAGIVGRFYKLGVDVKFQ